MYLLSTSASKVSAVMPSKLISSKSLIIASCASADDDAPYTIEAKELYWFVPRSHLKKLSKIEERSGSLETARSAISL